MWTALTLSTSCYNGAVFCSDFCKSLMKCLYIIYIYMLSTAVPSFQPIFVKGFFVNLRYAFGHIQPPTGVVSHSLKTNAIIVITSILNFYCHSNLQVAGF